MTTTASQTPVVSLVDVDEDFARLVPEEDLDLARRALTLRELRFDAGTPITYTDPEAIALLVVGGAIWRELRVGPGGAPQLLGPGSAICERPPADGGKPAHDGIALTRVRLAVLDRRFLLASTKWPALAAELMRRLADQERDLAVQAAICQLPRVDERLLALMWHLGQKWGRVGGGGLRLPMRLTHATLGRFVGARRPTVSLALAQLKDRGLIDRDDEGLWTLLGEAPSLAPDQEPPPPPDLFARR